MAATGSMLDARSPRRLAPLLWALLGLFVLRVIGQALVVFLRVSWLPPMREWYSGLLSYPLLLPAQLLIVLLLGAVCRDFTRGRGWFVTPRPRLGRWATWLGSIYLGAMIVRYAIWMTLHPDARWLGGTLPIVFHCVLATFVILFGRHHRGGTTPAPTGA
jgi:hypothetical protein